MDDYAQLHPGAFAARTPDRPAVIMAGSGRVITFADFEALSNQCAHLLRSLGLARGDRVSILMENHPLYLPLAWGGMRAGLRVTAISTHLGSAEVDYILTDNDSQALLTSHPMAATAGALEAAGVPAAARLMADRQVAGFGDLDAALAAQPTTPIGDQSEGVEMLYSSGTTGRPKGVKKPLSDNPFGEPAAWHRTMMKLYEGDERSIYLSPAPLYHAAPLMFNIRSIRFGGTSVVMEKFDAESALALIEKYQITHSQWVPTHFIRMLRLPDDVRARYDLSSHRVAVHAAAPGRCQTPDDRLVGADYPRILRRLRRQWLLRHRQRRLAGQTGLGGACPDRHLAHLRRRRRSPAKWHAGHRFFRRRAGFRLSQRPGQDRRIAPSQRLEHPWRYWLCNSKLC